MLLGIEPVRKLRLTKTAGSELHLSGVNTYSPKRHSTFTQSQTTTNVSSCSTVLVVQHSLDERRRSNHVTNYQGPNGSDEGADWLYRMKVRDTAWC